MKIPYNYVVRNIGNEKESAYEAYIPALNYIVYGGDAREIEEGIVSAIKVTKDRYKKEKRPMPPPDYAPKKSGKLVLRLPPRVHERLALEAALHGISLNKLIEEKVSA